MTIQLTSCVTRSEDPAGVRIFHAVELSIAEELHQLLQRAELCGFVVTVGLVPNEPLAMGNYRMVGHVRGGR